MVSFDITQPNLEPPIKVSLYLNHYLSWIKPAVVEPGPAQPQLVMLMIKTNIHKNT